MSGAAEPRHHRERLAVLLATMTKTFTEVSRRLHTQAPSVRIEPRLGHVTTSRTRVIRPTTNCVGPVRMPRLRHEPYRRPKVNDFEPAIVSLPRAAEPDVAGEHDTFIPRRRGEPMHFDHGFLRDNAALDMSYRRGFPDTFEQDETFRPPTQSRTRRR